METEKLLEEMAEAAHRHEWGSLPKSRQWAELYPEEKEAFKELLLVALRALKDAFAPHFLVHPDYQRDGIGNAVLALTEPTQ